MTDDLAFRSAAALAADIRSGEVSPVAVVDAVFARIDAVDDDVNAFITLLRERARREAEEAQKAVERGDDLGPLHGVPVAIKDLTQLEGEKLTFGAKPLAENVAQQTAPVVQRLLDAGAIPIGKTNTPEFGLKVITDNQLVGPTATPFDLEKNAGGSSGGSAAAVAAGMVPIAEGSDAGGSVRIPSSFCHVVGVKPSFGRLPVANRPNAFGIHTPMIHEGVHARTVEDAALMLDVMAGPHPRDPFSLPDDGTQFSGAVGRDVTDKSVAYSPDLGVFPIDPAVEAGVEQAVDGFEAAGFDVEEVDVDFGHDLDTLLQEGSLPQWEVNVAALSELLSEAFGIDVPGEDAADLFPHMVEMAEQGYDHDALTYVQCDAIRTDVFDGIQDVFADHDLLVCPVTTVPPFEHGIPGPDEVDGIPVDKYSGWFLTFIFNLTGHPVASVPAALTDDGLPVGVQIVGRRHADEDVIAAAAALEAERPWLGDYPWA